MKPSSFLILVSVLFSLTIATIPAPAQSGETFRGGAQSVSGGVLTVSGGDETHKFRISRSTRVLDSQGKPTNISHALNQSVEVTYTGKKEPYNAISVQCLEE